MSHLFAYGSLQIPEVFATVTGQQVQGLPTRVEGYARYRLKGLPYPGLVAEPNSMTHGMLYHDLNAESWMRLDQFEDIFYRREILEVWSPELGTIRAKGYVIPPGESRRIDWREWSLEEFRREHLADFMRRCDGWISPACPVPPSEERI